MLKKESPDRAQGEGTRLSSVFRQARGSVASLNIVQDPDGHRIRFGSDSTGPADPGVVGRYWDELQFPDR